MKVLVTGGAGYVGGCVCDALEDRGHAPVVVDDLRAGGPAPAGGRAFHAADVADGAALRGVFEAHPDIACTVHCAALTAAPASWRRPHEYYAVNVGGSLALFAALRATGRGRVVLSSSASVYGATAGRVAETVPLRPASPYGRTKQMAETILEDFCRAYGFQAIAFRYFNAVGADPRLRSGPRARPPADAVGRLVEVALGGRPAFQITGTDWPTRDGTGLRDYVHVRDIAEAHVAAVEQLCGAAPRPAPRSFTAVNLGAGRGVTVRELVAAFERVLGRRVATADAPRRPGDFAGAYAAIDRARDLLGWAPERPLDQGLADALAWGRRVRYDCSQTHRAQPRDQEASVEAG